MKNHHHSLLKYFQTILTLLLFFTMGTTQITAADMQPTSFTDSRDPAPSGGLIDYIITFQNNVPIAAINPELNVSIPTGFEFISVNNPNVTCNYGG